MSLKEYVDIKWEFSPLLDLILRYFDLRYLVYDLEILIKVISKRNLLDFDLCYNLCIHYNAIRLCALGSNPCDLVLTRRRYYIELIRCKSIYRTNNIRNKFQVNYEKLPEVRFFLKRMQQIISHISNKSV